MRSTAETSERVGTLVIGGGQAGLSVGYHLARREIPFLIVDERKRVGDAWRARWDSLRLFTPARYDGLDGMPFPARPHYFPTKDEMADYLEAYRDRFRLPVRNGTRIEGLTRDRDRFVATSSEGHRFEAEHVVVAMAGYQMPWSPVFASDLDPGLCQLHSADYRNPRQLRDGPVLLVGGGNSGSEIAMELVGRHEVWMSGRDTGSIPFRIEGRAARLALLRLVLRGLFHHVLTVDNPIGRRARRKVLGKGGPLVRVKPRDLARKGVERVPRTAGVQDGVPVLEDGRVLEVANVIWCTGFRPGFDWIEGVAEPVRKARRGSGSVEDVPGLHFVGLHFLHALSSAMIHGVGRDAGRVARRIAATEQPARRRRPGEERVRRPWTSPRHRGSSSTPTCSSAPPSTVGAGPPS